MAVQIEAQNAKQPDCGLKPGFCCIGVTDKCMLRCKMCYKWQDDIFTKNAKPQDFATLDHYKNFISGLREMADDNNFMINFGGGEALLMEGVLELVDYAVKKGFRTNIASNGWLIDDEIAGRIADSGLNEINISLDSLKETTHDFLRGRRGVHARAMRAIDDIHKHCKNIKMGICSVIYETNLDDILPLIEWVNNNPKLSAVSFMAAMQPNNTVFEKEWWKGKYSFLWPKDPKKVCALIDEIIRLKENGCRIGNSAVQLEAFKRYFQFPGKPVRKNKCHLDKAIIISAVGELVPCIEYKTTAGDIKTSDIRQIWHSQELSDVRKKMAECTYNCHLSLNCYFNGDKAC